MLYPDVEDRIRGNRLKKKIYIYINLVLTQYNFFYGFLHFSVPRK